MVGITDRSFSQPYVLLSARIDPDEGYFQERLASAREQLVQAWKKRSSSLVSRFNQTDILGSLVLAAQLFEGHRNQRNVLIIFSDMRQETPALSLAALRTVPVTPAIKKVEEEHLIAKLGGVEVFVLGVDAAGKDVRYWNSLHDFWAEYFTRAGANLRSYTTLRELA